MKISKPKALLLATLIAGGTVTPSFGYNRYRDDTESEAKTFLLGVFKAMTSIGAADAVFLLTEAALTKQLSLLGKKITAKDLETIKSATGSLGLISIPLFYKIQTYLYGQSEGYSW